MFRHGVVALLALAMFGVFATAEDVGTRFDGETAAQRDARIQWFRDAKFGLFIHWGLYAVPAGEWHGKTDSAEWIADKKKIPMSEYEKFRDRFNPAKFDAAEWVSLAKQAGVKYVVITSKHHDGFAMYDTKLSDWGIRSTPYRSDPMKELAAECRKAGIKFCFYYSILDWHHPDYAPRARINDVAVGEPDMDRYVQFMKGQLKELTTNYGPLGILWFDGEWDKTWTKDRGRDLYNYVRGLQPDIIINNRVARNRQGMDGMSRGKDVIGDYGTPERELPDNGMPPGVDWESCMTMNDHWGYHKRDQNWKSTTTLIRMLIEVASKGGNLLLNVGPTAEGLIPGPSVERLREIGRWLEVNGESIYGASACPFVKSPAWGCVTQKSGKLYLHVFDWPQDGRLVVPRPVDEPVSAYLLADPKQTPLDMSVHGKDVVISLPAEAPDQAASVVVLELAANR